MKLLFLIGFVLILGFSLATNSTVQNDTKTAENTTTEATPETKRRIIVDMVHAAMEAIAQNIMTDIDKIYNQTGQKLVAEVTPTPEGR